MSFDIFENIYTASDPAGGRSIKVSMKAGIDNAESYYTQNDPSGGRAIKMMIVSGITSNVSGLASTPALSLTGNWYTGGTISTTTPQLLIKPASATSPNWDINGTGLGIASASGFSGNLLAMYNNGTPALSVNSNGVMFFGANSIQVKPATPTGDGTGGGNLSGAALSINPVNASSGFGLIIANANTTATSGTNGAVNIGSAFVPSSSGSGVFNPLNIKYTIDAAAGVQSGTVNGIFLNATQTNLNGATHNLIDLQVGNVSRFKVLSSGLTTIRTATTNQSGTTTNDVLSLAPVDTANSATSYNSPALSFDVSAWNGSSAVTRGFKMFAKTFAGTGQNDPEFNIFGPTGVQLMRLNTSVLGLSVGGITVDASAGLSIATANNQKIAFWGKTPIIQPTTSITGVTRTAVAGGGTVLDSDTFSGYTIGKVVAALINSGILA